MSNMSYCRFENTSKDLRDCLDHFDDIEDASEYEIRGRKNIIEMCVEIANDYAEELDE